MKPKSRKITRRLVAACLGITGGALALFTIFVTGKILLRAEPVKAASSVLYPSFCLGGWEGSQNAAGAPDGDVNDPSSYDEANSAFLKSGVASQLFCGYFTTTNKTNPPARVVVSFNWDVRDSSSQGSTTDTAPSNASTSDQQSYTSNSQYLVSPATGFIVPVPTSTPSTNDVASSTTATTPSAPVSTGTSTTPDPGTTTDVPKPSSDSTDMNSKPAPQASDPAPSNASSEATQAPTDQSASTPAATTPPADESQSAPTAVPAPAASPAPAPASDPTTSYLAPFIGLIASKAEAAVDQSHSDSPFLSVSYSVDGVRWVQIGTIGHDNWKNYRVVVPIDSWDDVNHLQIMLNVLPSIDSMPDIYLESLQARADYSRTIAEALAAAAGSADDAANSLVDKLLKTLKDEPKAELPAPLEIVHKKLLSSVKGNSIPLGHHSDVKANSNSDTSALTLSGSCTKKYFVVLVYRKQDDYSKNPASYITNIAQECQNGRFNFDLSTLSPDIPSGTYYLQEAEEDETGPWKAVSDIFPITLTASSTVETVSQ